MVKLFFPPIWPHLSWNMSTSNTFTVILFPLFSCHHQMMRRNDMKECNEIPLCLISYLKIESDDDVLEKVVGWSEFLESVSVKNPSGTKKFNHFPTAGFPVLSGGSHMVFGDSCDPQVKRVKATFWVSTNLVHILSYVSYVLKSQLPWGCDSGFLYHLRCSVRIWQFAPFLKAKLTRLTKSVP